MLSLSAQRQLAELMSEVYQLLDSVYAEAAKPEVALRVAAARQKLDDLEEMVGPQPGRAFGNMARHLHWLGRYYQEDRPDRYAADIQDIRGRDLPGVIRAVEDWNSGPIDVGLFAAINEPWEAQSYADVIRKSFIYFETIIRDLGGVDPSRGLSGEKLVSIVLDPSNSTHIDLPADTFIGTWTRGEAAGFYYLVRGAFLLFRNAAAHREIDLTPGAAEDIVRLVDLCLRLLPSKPPDS